MSSAIVEARIERQCAAILDLVGKAADAGLECPTNGELGRAVGCTPASAGDRLGRLAQHGVIRIELCGRFRAVTIVATGRSTARHVVSNETLQRRAIALDPAPATAEVLPPIIDRGPCPRCGVRGDIGCAHQARSETHALHDERIAA